MRVTLDHIDDIATNIKTFWFKPGQPVQYEAGQFIELYIPHKNPDERGQKHWFTLSSSPSEPLLSITTKFATDRSSTFKQALRELSLGTELMMAEPMGDFVLPKDATIPIVFVGGGIGVTPMRSMIKYLTDTGEQRDIHLLYAANRPEDFAFTDLFREYLGDKFVPVVKEPDDRWKGETGSLTPERVLALANDDKRALFYLSGPKPMIEAFARELAAAGVDKHRIVTDFFPGYAQF